MSLEPEVQVRSAGNRVSRKKVANIDVALFGRFLADSLPWAKNVDWRISIAMNGLHLLPCLDSSEMAAARRRELDIPREVAAKFGQSAVEAAVKGFYFNKAGEKVDWSHLVNAACSGKRSIPPDALLPNQAHHPITEASVQVTNETTLGASLRLVEAGLRPLALNFANGVHPGGGFLGGARAQEEVLCRSSALYQTLVNDQMYEEHGKRPRPDSTDWAIYSPDVPVFRKDDGTELDKPWLLSFITCAAPVAWRIGQPESGDLLRKRIHRVLAIAQAFGYSSLVLGAWGCGAFGNDTQRTAFDFRNALENEFSGALSYSRSQIGPQREDFSDPSGMFLLKTSWRRFESVKGSTS